MAKKKTGAKKVEATIEATKPVRLDVPIEDHQLLRFTAAINGKSMASFARDVVVEYVRAEAKRRGIKP